MNGQRGTAGQLCRLKRRDGRVKKSQWQASGQSDKRGKQTGKKVQQAGPVDIRGGVSDSGGDIWMGEGAKEGWRADRRRMRPNGQKGAAR